MPLMNSSSSGEIAKKFGSSLNLASLKVSHKGRAFVSSTMDKSVLESKRTRLHDLLLQQFLAKYGVKKEDSSINLAIRSTIHNFVHGNSDLADISQGATSGELDALVRNAVSKAKTSGVKKTSQNFAFCEVKPSSSGLTQKQRQELMLPLNNSVEESQINQWKVLAAMDNVAEEKKKMKEMQERVANQKEFKQVLDQQRREHQEMQENERREKAALLQQTISKTKMFEDELENSKMLKLKGFEVEREMRLRQMESRQRQRQMERDQKIAEERKDMERAQQAQDEEEVLKHQRKLEQKRLKESAIAENERNRAQKIEEMRLHREKEQSMMKEYAAKLEREEKLRNEAFQTRVEALQQIATRHHESVGVAVTSAQVDRDVKERTAVELKLRKDAEEERLRKERQKMTSIEALKENQLLVRQKEQAKVRVREEDVRTRERLDREAVEAQRKEEAEARRRRDVSDQLRLAQEKQIQERQLAKKSGKLDPVDEQIVSKLIKQKVREDPELYKKAIEKITTERTDRKPLPKI